MVDKTSGRSPNRPRDQHKHQIKQPPQTWTGKRSHDRHGATGPFTQSSCGGPPRATMFGPEQSRNTAHHVPSGGQQGLRPGNEHTWCKVNSPGVACAGHTLLKLAQPGDISDTQAESPGLGVQLRPAALPSRPRLLHFPRPPALE